MGENHDLDALPAVQRVTQKTLNAIERFLHIEAASGIVLLLAAAVALIWANSPASSSYEYLWHLPITVTIDKFTFSQSLHFMINDGLMTIFFLVVGMEIRREINDGALASFQQAALPMGAALGGVIAPALFYLTLSRSNEISQGWAIPTATDIAFAVGVLALLGKSIPASARIFLLTLAIIDDIAAVLIIALFYSGGLAPAGFIIAIVGILMVFAFQRMGFGSAYIYILPGAVIWIGFLMAGAHPTLAGVVLGLMTPAVPVRGHVRAADMAANAIGEFGDIASNDNPNADELLQPVKKLKYAQRELLPPVIRVQDALHPWVAFGIMPVFALANAGVDIGNINLHAGNSLNVLTCVALALFFGKPVGVIVSSWLLICLGWCRFADGLTWSWLFLISCLTGIGFTMSIFIANLAFADAGTLGAAKLGVLIGSAGAGILGLSVGVLLIRAQARKRT